MTFDSNVPYAALLRPELSDLKAYLPDQDNYEVRLDANEAPPLQSEYVHRRLTEVAARVAWERYPDPSALELREALANRCGALADEVLVGVGSDELIALLLTALSQTGDSHNPPTVLTVSPTFVMYKLSAKVRGFRVLEVPLDETWDLAEKWAVPRSCKPRRPSCYSLRAPITRQEIWLAATGWSACLNPHQTPCASLTRLISTMQTAHIWNCESDFQI